MAETISPEAYYVQLGRLIAETPEMEISGPFPAETMMWLGRTYALLSRKSARTALDFRAAMDLAVSRTDWLLREQYVESMRSILYRALAMAELEAPTGVQGAFIAAGNAFDALTAITRVLGPASTSVLIVDPYMDEKTLTDFVPLANEGVQIRLLSDARTVKPSLKPAVSRWQSQYGPIRPLEARLAPSATLHDRLMIIDDDTVWVLTQSLNAFANRAPASIVRVDQETAALKVAAYSNIWSAAVVLI
jgi:hypothetical protein